MRPLLTASEVAARAGIDYQTLLHWVRYGWVEAEERPATQWQPVLFTRAQARAVT